MQEITIRKATGEDEPITLDIRHKAWLKAYNHIFTEEEINNHFKVKIENGCQSTAVFLDSMIKFEGKSLVVTEDVVFRCGSITLGRKQLLTVF